MVRPFLLFALAASGALLAAAAAQPDLGGAKTVYLMPMAGGLDQYLANRLTGKSPLQVVTDPAQADAVFTDRLGEVFEARMNQLYPPAEAADEDSSSNDDRSTRISSFTKGRGNVFLVDRKSRRVLWSTYLRPKNSSADEMDRAAVHIVSRLADRPKAK